MKPNKFNASMSLQLKIVAVVQQKNQNFKQKHNEWWEITRNYICIFNPDFGIFVNNTFKD